MGKAKLSGKSGVYIIKNSIDKSVYVGSSIDIYSRFQYHKKNLKNFKHVNQKLNNFCKKYGNDKFIFEVIEFCNKEVLIEREQYYMDIFKSYIVGFNISKTASYPYKDLSEEQIKERRKIFAEKRGTPFYMYDKSLNVNYFKSLKECERTTQISSSKISECLNKNKYHKLYVFSKIPLIKNDIIKQFELSSKHFNSIKMQKIKNIKTTKSFIEPKSVTIHKHEILNYNLSEELSNKIKSAFVYNKNTKKLTLLSSIPFENGNYIYAPTQSLLQRWLREIYGIHICVDIDINGNWFFNIYNLNSKRCAEFPEANKDEFNSYEIALDAGLEIALKLIKDESNNN